MNKDKKILICDDEPLIIEIVEYVTHKCGYKLLKARDGKEAIAIAKKDKPDLMLLDVNMPYITGYDVCKQLKMDEDTKDIVILMFTANVQVTDYEKSKLVGADGFIEKPFDLDDLMMIINNHLNK